jgi:hypothetical protein
LREHPVGLQIGELIEAHGRGNVECFAVHSGPRLNGDATYRRLRTALDKFLDITRLSGEEAASRLCALEIGIFVDPGGHTLDARTGIVARRPAPVQVRWLGCPGTSGLSAIDYLLADRYVAPSGGRNVAPAEVFARAGRSIGGVANVVARRMNVRAACRKSIDRSGSGAPCFLVALRAGLSPTSFLSLVLPRLAGHQAARGGSTRRCRSASAVRR